MEDWNAWKPHARPQLRLFLSADIVGSTALKQNSIQNDDGLAIPDNSRWFECIQNFYIQSVHEVFAEWTKQLAGERDADTMLGRKPSLWKTIGDEVLFWKDVSDHRQVLRTIQVWMSAIDSIRTSLQKVSPRLDVKCLAWLAHFPWRNKMLISSPLGLTGAEDDGRADDNTQLMERYYDDPISHAFNVDFAGPGIDLGFRLSALSSSRKFVIGMDVAYLMSLVLAERRKRPAINLHYDGMQQFKGVISGLPYPVFWIDMGVENEIDRFDHDLTTRTPCDSRDVKSFCESYYDARSNYFYRPFIVSESEKTLTQRPNWYDEAHKSLLSPSDRIEG